MIGTNQKEKLKMSLERGKNKSFKVTDALQHMGKQNKNIIKITYATKKCA